MCSNTPHNSPIVHRGKYFRIDPIFLFDFRVGMY